MLTAYFDESYNHRTEKNAHEPLVYTVGCWLSTREQWEMFGIRWRSALKKAKIDWFHMKEFENRKDVYEKWSETKRVRTLQRLHGIMNDHIMYGCAVVVNRADFDDIIKPNPYFRKYFGRTHYGFDVQTAIININEWCDEQKIGRA